MEILKKN